MNLYERVKSNLKEYDDELEINYYKHFDHVNDVWNYLEGSTSEDDLNERISEVDPHKFGSIYYDLHDDGNGATVIIDYQSDNEDYYEKVDVYFNENINEAELQSLFTIITDEARKHNNYAHYSPREVDSQDIKNMIKDLKRKGGREVKSNVYVLEDFIYDLNNGITVSENNEDEYKVVPVNEAEKPKDYLDDIMLNEFTDDYYKWGEDDHEWTKDEMEGWIIRHKEDNPDTTIDLIHLDNLLDFQHELYKQDKEDGMLEEAEGSGNIEYATPNYTGGSIYVYTGKLKDGNYFMASDEWLDKYNKAFAIRIVNEDPDTAKDPNQDDIAWFPEWQESRLVKDLEGKEALNFTKEILNWVIANKPAGNYQMADIKGMLDFVEGKSDSVY